MGQANGVACQANAEFQFKREKIKNVKRKLWNKVEECIRITIFVDELDLEKFESLHMRFKPSIGKKFQLDLEETTHKSI
jgi:hypothetical protein